MSFAASRYASLLAMVSLAAYACSAQAQSVLAQSLQRAMHGRKGAAVVMDVAGGRVLASYDVDRAARRLVRPGSAIKPFVLATLADHDLLRDEHGVRCSRTLSIAGRKLNCGHPSTASRLHAEEALAYSCNTYFTQMGAHLTPAQLQRGLLRWGLASRTGVCSDEVSGFVDLSHTTEQVELQSIGEENVLVTPLGLLNGYRRLALERKAGTSRTAHQPVFRGLEAATTYGMSRLAQPQGVNFKGRPLRVAGKTGTSMAAEGPWTHAWFAGFAPAEQPQIVLLVFLEQGAGPTDAAPIARELFAAWAAEKAQ